MKQQSEFLGKRCKYSEEWLKGYFGESKERAKLRRGTIIGEVYEDKRGWLINFDGNKTNTCIHKSFIELIETNELGFRVLKQKKQKKLLIGGLTKEQIEYRKKLFNPKKKENQIIDNLKNNLK